MKFLVGWLILLAAFEPPALLSQETRGEEAAGTVAPRAGEDTGTGGGRTWFWGVGGGVEFVSGPSLPESLAFDHPLFGSEPGELSARYKSGSAAFFEVSLGYSMQRRAAVVVTLATSSHKRDVHVEAALPHPFFFERSRSVVGPVGVALEQTSVHVSAMWRPLEGRKVEAALFGGPSWFKVDQELAVGVRFDSEYPYDEAFLTGPEVRLHSRGATGVHAGAEVVYWFRPGSGLLGTIRYVHAPEEFELPDGARLDLDPGGGQVLAGIRFRFR